MILLIVMSNFPDWKEICQEAGAISRLWTQQKWLNFLRRPVAGMPSLIKWVMPCWCWTSPNIGDTLCSALIFISSFQTTIRNKKNTCKRNFLLWLLNPLWIYWISLSIKINGTNWTISNWAEYALFYGYSIAHVLGSLHFSWWLDAK